MTVIAVAAVALLTTACGDGDGDGDAGDGSAAGEEADDDIAADADANGLRSEGDTGPDDIDPVTLSYASFVSDQNPHSVAAQAWMENVTERTGGAITFETFYAEALCAGPEIRACTSDGRADIGLSTVTYNPSDWPLGTVSNVPFQSNNIQAVANALNDLYRENQYVRAEFEDMNQHLLYYGPVGVPLLGMTQPIESLDDLSGLSIRGVGNIQGGFEALGINSVAVAPAEQYEALQRGVLDGSAFTLDGHADFRLFEVAEYYYDLGEYTGNYTAIHTAINQNVWDSLDTRVQEVMTEVSAEIANSFVEAFFADSDRRDCETLVAEVEFFGRLEPADEAEAWASEMADRAIEDWTESARQAGVEGLDETVDDYLRLLRMYEETESDAQRSGEICLEVWQGE